MDLCIVAVVAGMDLPKVLTERAVRTRKAYLQA